MTETFESEKEKPSKAELGKQLIKNYISKEIGGEVPTAHFTVTRGEEEVLDPELNFDDPSLREDLEMAYEVLSGTVEEEKYMAYVYKRRQDLREQERRGELNKTQMALFAALNNMAMALFHKRKRGKK